MLGAIDMGEERKEHELILQNKDDREAVALALYRAGYTVRERRRKDGGKTVVYLEYWK